MTFERGNKFIALVLALAVGGSQTLIATSAMGQSLPRLAGELSVRGVVMLNGVRVTSGATVLNSGKLQTGENGAAMINLGGLGQVELAAGSELVLRVENNVLGGSLRTGRAVFSAPAGISLNVATGEGVATTDGVEAAVVTVDSECGATEVASSRSVVKVTSGTGVETVAAGNKVSVGSAQAPNCQRMAVIPATHGLGPGGIGALLLVGVGGLLIGILAVTKANGSGTSNLNISNFRP